MKYLIIEHSSGKYFAFNLLDAEESSSAFSIVQDKFEFMVMGWKVAKAIPTWVLGFSNWKNLMISYDGAINQEDGNLHSNVDHNVKVLNCDNNDENNWNQNEFQDAKIKCADPLYVGDGLFQGDPLPKSDDNEVVNESNAATAGNTMYKQAVSSCP